MKGTHKIGSEPTKLSAICYVTVNYSVNEIVGFVNKFATYNYTSTKRQNTHPKNSASGPAPLTRAFSEQASVYSTSYFLESLSQ